MAGMFEQVIYCRWNLKHRQSKLSYTHTLSGCIRVAEYRAHDRSKIGNVLIIAFATVDGTINVCMHVCMSEWFTLCNVSNASVKIGILFIYLAVSSNIREKAKEQTMAEINVRRSVRNYGVNFPFAMYFYDHIIMNGRIVDRVSAVRAWSEQEMSVCVCVCVVRCGTMHNVFGSRYRYPCASFDKIIHNIFKCIVHNFNWMWQHLHNDFG